ncbi:MAG: sugar-binding protein, partial [Candidatus Sumerlaeota bacterium]
MFRKYVFQMGLLLSLLLCGACSEFNGKEAEVAFPDVPEYEVPAVSGITVDGRLDNWAAAGLEVKALAPLSGRVPDPDDLSAKVRLGWTTEGLLVAIDVRDDVAREAPVGGRLFRGDCIHLYYAERRGGRNTYQAIITPGRGADAPEMRIMLSDRRKQAKELGAINLDYKFTHYDQGYRFEALLPWSAVGTEATEGATAALQVFVADADRGEGMTQGWYPERGDWRKALALQPLVMRSDKAVPPLSASAFSRVSDMSHISIAVAASSDIADRSVHAVSRSGMRVQTELVDRGGVLEAYMHWPLARDNDSAEPVAVYAGSRLLGVLSPPHLDQERIREYVQTSVEFKPALFTGDRFPSFDYPDPEYME